MNSELKEKIQTVANQPNKYVREKTKIQRFLDYPPIELIGDVADDIVAYKGKFIFLYIKKFRPTSIFR
jgi:hypothetical protein